ncbi:MAG: hypothetical protein RLZZ381_537 [Cyanobacteriota bacterium]|jgi:PAS domain S-box-containing protein
MFTIQKKSLLTAQIAGIIVTLVGGLVLVGGWGMDLALFKSIAGDAAEMKANTALCFILAGISLGWQTGKRRNYRVAKGLAIAVSAIGILTLSQYLLGWNLGIDQLLFQQLPGDPTIKYPGRMGDNTALNFALVGLALYVLGRRTRHSDNLAQTATFCATAIAVLALIGHVYNVQIFYRFIFYSSSMALHTCLTFLVLCLGILSIQTDCGLIQTLTSNLAGGTVARRLISMAIAIPFLLGWLILQGLRANLYDSAFALGLLVVLLIFTLVLVIWKNAQRLNQLDYDRNRSDDRLRSSEQRYRNIFESVGVSIWEEDFSEVKAAIDRLKASGVRDFQAYFAEHPEFIQWAISAIRILDVNDFTLQMTGTRDKDKLLASLQEIFLPETIPTFIAELVAIAEGKTFFQSETSMKTLEGEKLYVLFSITFPPPTEPYNRVLVTWSDISDRKRAQLNEQFLNELDLRLRQLSDVEAMQWEVISSLGQYLNVNRATWCEVDWENRLLTIDRDWRQEDLPSHAGTYSITDFISPELQVAHAGGETIVFSDVAIDPHSASYANAYQQLGVGAMVTVPCIQEGRWVSALTVNTRTARNWRDDEVTLLQETVARLWSIIEQMRALQALRESEYQYRTLFETIDQGFCVCQMLFDENGEPSDYRFLEVNSVFGQMTGLQQAKGKTARELVPNLEDFWIQTYGRVVLTGEPIRFENQSKAMNRWFNVSAFRFDEGQNDKFAVLFTNITDRKQAELALTENNNILQAVISGTKDIIYVKDLQGRYVMSNQAAAQWLNVTVNSMIGQDDLDLFPAEVAQRIQTDDRRVIDANESVIYEEQLLKGDELRSLITGKYPWRNEQGEVKGIIGISRDVTDFKQAEADLKERNDHIQILYEITRDLLSTKQPLSLVEALFAKLKPLIGLDVYFNYLLDEQQQKLNLIFHHGISKETAREIEWLDIGQAVCGTVAQQRCQIVQLNLQQSTDPKTELVRSLGLTAYSCQPLISQGKLFGTLGFGSLTRTEFNSSETRLFQAICDRIAIALERTEILSSLQQQTEELTRANRLKDEFLAALSHELRTPLNPIMGWTKLLQTQQLTPAKTQDALSTIERNVKQQIALVDDLLDVSRVVQGQFKLTSQPVDLVPILDAARDSVRFAAIAKSITLEFHYLADSISQVMGDELRLQQVFWNLLANAIKFTPNNGRVDVWLEQVQNTQNNTQNNAQIRVTDTGIGIAAEFLPYVFDRFRQADGSSTRRYGGLGLGLALVKHLVELHGGTVSAESLGVGRGATFKVNLPLLRSASSNLVTSNPQQTKTDLSSSTSESLTGIRVLVVDDEPDNLELLDFVLTQEGAIATTVTGATEALAIISQNPPDILISDIGMPDMDGYELLQQVRALPSQQNKSLKAIALTAFAQEEDRERIKNAGFQAYLTKPCNLVDLIAAIALEVG